MKLGVSCMLTSSGTPINDLGAAEYRVVAALCRAYGQWISIDELLKAGCYLEADAGKRSALNKLLQRFGSKLGRYQDRLVRQGDRCRLILDVDWPACMYDE